jgi:L-fuculose-phosphate aldolase
VLSTHGEACAEVLTTARRMFESGLTVGTSGNVSARLDDGNIVITPSSVRYDEMSLNDLVVLAPDGEQVAGTRAPSSEKLLHLACYRAFPEIGSVLHSHPAYATMFACAQQPVPPVIDEALIFAGGEVPVAAYAMSGSPEVGVNAVAVLKQAGSALLASHGLVTVAATPAKALHQAGVVEHCAHVAWGTRSLGGHVPLPQRTLTDFAAVYQFFRQNPSP